MRHWFLGAALLLAATSTAHAAEWRLSTGGYGPARVGMNAEEVGRALGVVVAPPAAWDEPLCYYAATRPELLGVGLMMSEGRVVRFDVSAAGVVTRSGLGIGDDEARVIAVLGTDAIEISPHKYGGPEDHYLTIWTDDRRAALRFETVGGKVTAFYAGRVPEALNVEGCS